MPHRESFYFMGSEPYKVQTFERGVGRRAHRALQRERDVAATSRGVMCVTADRGSTPNGYPAASTSQDRRIRIANKAKPQAAA
jgi:hypothetical protein